MRDLRVYRVSQSDESWVNFCQCLACKYHFGVHHELVMMDTLKFCPCCGVPFTQLQCRQHYTPAWLWRRWQNDVPRHIRDQIERQRPVGVSAGECEWVLWCRKSGVVYDRNTAMPYTEPWCVERRMFGSAISVYETMLKPYRERAATNLANWLKNFPDDIGVRRTEYKLLPHGREPEDS